MLLDNTHIEDVIKAVHCSHTSCPNQNNYCYELDGIHLKLIPPHLKTWSISINEGTASLEAPPDGLTANLAPSKASTHNPLRSGTGQKAAKSNLSPEETF